MAIDPDPLEIAMAASIASIFGGDTEEPVTTGITTMDVDEEDDAEREISDKPPPKLVEKIHVPGPNQKFYVKRTRWVCPCLIQPPSSHQFFPL